MLKFAALAALATAAGLAAVPANAQTSDAVRIPVAGKTVAQLNSEIDAAARSVCGAVNTACYEDAVRGARRQLAALTHRSERADTLRVAVLDNGVYAVRVSLIGKSTDQVNKAIDAAAVAVCRPATSGRADYNTCVSTALQSAQNQLHGQKLAANN